VFGDFVVDFYDVDSVGTVSKVLSFWAHTYFISLSHCFLRLHKPQLDIEKPEGFDKNFAIEMYFSPP